jgi:energy-coupling factor transport system substrate-specific component
MARRGWFRGVGRIIPTGVGLGILAAIVSAPVIVGLFGGLTGNGASLVVAFLLATGKSVMKSVILAGLAAEPLDKTLQCLIAYWLLKGMPKTVLAGLKKGSLRQNGFVA